MGVAIRERNLPGIPHWDWLDFFIDLMIFDSSIGLVLIADKSDKTSNLCSCGGTSSGLGTVALLAKCWFM